MAIEKYTIKSNADIFGALEAIDLNKKGFLVVLDAEEKVTGTLTDGDIRRAILKGAKGEDPISGYYSVNFRSLGADAGISGAIDMFKNDSIKFIPIVGEDGKLLNIITKNQLHSILLQDIRADLLYDFELLDDNIINHEIFPRPWGFYKTTVMNDYCQSKIICVYPGGRLSLQSHDRREEHWVVAHGNGIVEIDGVEKEAVSGSYFYIPKGSRHRLSNTDKNENLVITEVQIGDYFGEDDIHRYDDVYGRA